MSALVIFFSKSTSSNWGTLSTRVLTEDPLELCDRYIRMNILTISRHLSTTYGQDSVLVSLPFGIMNIEIDLSSTANPSNPSNCVRYQVRKCA